MQEWKEQYAPTRYSQDLGYHQPRLRLGVMHHVNPNVEGSAHCSTSVMLDLSKVTTKHPREALCIRCKRLRPFYAEAIHEQTTREG